MKSLRAFPAGELAHFADSDMKLRRAAARLLSESATLDALDPLLEALGNSDDEVRRFAAVGLGSLGSAQAVEPLSRALIDPSVPVRRFAAEALGALQDLRAADVLFGALTDVDRSVRITAVGSLCALPDSRGEDPALEILVNWDSVDDLANEADADDDRLLCWLTRGLSRLDSARARTALTTCLSDGSSLKRKAAVHALADRMNDSERALISRDCNGRSPWLDPWDPITRGRVEKCANQLKISANAVRAQYQALAPALGLRLTWPVADSAPAPLSGDGSV